MTATERTTSDRAARPPRARARGRSAISDGQRARVLALHADGVGRNAIAAEVGISGASVSAIVRDAGGSFDRTATAAATEARAVDQRAARVEAAAGLLDDVQRGRLLLAEQLAKSDARGFADAARGIAALVTGVGRLVDLTPEDDGLDAARSMLGDVAAAIGDAYAQVKAEEPALPEQGAA
jgi:hypothetical protein